MTLIRIYFEPIGYKDYICHSVELNFKEKTATIKGGDNDGTTFQNVRGAKVVNEHPYKQEELL